MAWTKYRIWTLAGILVFGLAIGGPALTGNVTGASEPGDGTMTLLGFLIMLVGSALLVGEVVWQRKKREEAERTERDRKLRVM